MDRELFDLRSHTVTRPAAAMREAMARAAVGDDVYGVETNMVVIELDRASCEAVLAAARQRGVLLGPLARRRLRAVTHLDIAMERARLATERLAEAIEAAERGAQT